MFSTRSPGSSMATLWVSSSKKSFFHPLRWSDLSSSFSVFYQDVITPSLPWRDISKLPPFSPHTYPPFSSHSFQKGAWEVPGCIPDPWFTCPKNFCSNPWGPERHQGHFWPSSMPCPQTLHSPNSWEATWEYLSELRSRQIGIQFIQPFNQHLLSNVQHIRNIDVSKADLALGLTELWNDERIQTSKQGVTVQCD